MNIMATDPTSKALRDAETHLESIEREAKAPPPPLPPAPKPSAEAKTVEQALNERVERIRRPGSGS